MKRSLLVTSALPYANGAIHLGHLVEYIQTDIWVRFQKLIGNQATYVCADDTHGTPIMLRAEKEGITPEALIARVHNEHLRDFTGFHINFDLYHSTHSDENRECAETIYRNLQAAGLIEVFQRRLFTFSRFSTTGLTLMSKASPVDRESFEPIGVWSIVLSPMNCGSPFLSRM